MIAIIAGESEADGFSDILQSDGERLCSALSVWETVAGLCRSHGYNVPDARALVNRYVLAGRFQYVPIGERETTLALDAYERFGKGRHPAALNMGDCHAYACAKTNRAKLLFKGDDFAKTDVVAAA